MRAGRGASTDYLREGCFLRSFAAILLDRLMIHIRRHVYSFTACRNRYVQKHVSNQRRE